VQTFFGEARGPWSLASRTITTHPFTLPWAPSRLSVDEEATTSSSVRLTVGAPVDDGGLDLVAYVVWKKHVEEGFHEDWLFAGEGPARRGQGRGMGDATSAKACRVDGLRTGVGSCHRAIHLCISCLLPSSLTMVDLPCSRLVCAGNFSARQSPVFTVRNLLPGATYIFKAAAVNGIGIGAQTQPSERVMTRKRGPEEGLLHIGGHGHKDAVEPNEHGVLGPVVVLDDTAETVGARRCLFTDESRIPIMNFGTGGRLAAGQALNLAPTTPPGDDQGSRRAARGDGLRGNVPPCLPSSTPYTGRHEELIITLMI
jgi:hypothetical protein